MKTSIPLLVPSMKNLVNTRVFPSMLSESRCFGMSLQDTQLTYFLPYSSTWICEPQPPVFLQHPDEENVTAAVMCILSGLDTIHLQRPGYNTFNSYYVDCSSLC